MPDGTRLHPALDVHEFEVYRADTAEKSGGIEQKMKNAEENAFKMEIVWKDPRQLGDFERNPHSNSRVDLLVKSIQEFGFRVPIEITKDDRIVDGRARRDAAIQAGLSSVPCFYGEDMPEDTLRAWRLVVNKLSEFREWDYAETMAELAALADFDLTEYGFPNLEDGDLDVSDDDFLKDTEIIRERTPKKVKCPHCGAEFEL